MGSLFQRTEVLGMKVAEQKTMQELGIATEYL